jgi:mycothiol S-conjugate amidase
MTERLCILSVHAHPDDEASKGAGSIAKYHAEGAHTVLVCCTGGEAGEVLNPELDMPEVKENLHQIRMEELARATKIIGYDEVVMLGYRDSGMPGWPGNFDLRCFGQAKVEEAVGRLVAIIRRVKPHVIVTYPDHERQQRYPHPDHLMVHTVSVAAFDAAADPDAYPWAGPTWQPLKLYYSAWSVKRFIAIHEKLLELGLESPFSDRLAAWKDAPDESTTSIDIKGFEDVSREALIAHATQVRGNGRGWFGSLPPEVARTIHPHEEYVLAKSHMKTRLPETDLFAGVREPAPKKRAGGAKRASPARKPAKKAAARKPTAKKR